MASAEPWLKIAGVSKRYEAAEAANAVTVLENVSLEVAKGESLAIVGPSGSGKSTLLQIIGTLDQPTSGTVVLDGKEVSQLTADEVATIRHREIGFVFQAHFLLPQCSVLENVLVPTLSKASEREEKGEQLEERAKRLLSRVGLSGRLEHRPGQLSGGERQRVAVVRALINSPKLLLADEPTGALDHASATALGALLVELNREEAVALIVVTHARELAQRMGRVYELMDGRLRMAA
jgi:lipoprotein-releasing system ATP-binding protein